MKRYLLAFFAIIALSNNALADQTLPNIATRLEKKVRIDLESCGLKLLDPQEAGLPASLWDATYAVVSPNRRVLAIFLQSYGDVGYLGGAHWRWVTPQQTYEHGILFSTDSFTATLPLAGTVANANRFATPAGMQFNLQCRSVGLVATVAQFENCLLNDFVNVITRQLCP